jgi:hypothetical protein
MALSLSSLPRVVRPKQPRNLAASAGAAAALLLVYLLASSSGWPWNPKRGFGLAFGFLAAALFVFEMAYPLRRPAARPFATAIAWLQAHLYLGLLALLALLAHMGFALPHGPLGWALLLLSLWTVGSGLVGVLLQKWIPTALAEGLSVTALFERIPELLEGIRREADATIEGASDRLDNFYQTQVRDLFRETRFSAGYLLNVRAGREEALAPLRRMAAALDAEERDKLDDLITLVTEKLELDAQFTLQRVLRSWLELTLHVPAAGLLMGLLAVHVLSWVLY